MSFIRIFGRIMPKGLRERYHTMVGYSTIKGDGDNFIGWSVVAGIIAGFATSVLISDKYSLPPLLVFIAAFIIVEFIIYMWLGLNVSSKAKQAESVLPDALQLMASNIRAGLTTDKALLMAARPEFGALEEEIRRVGKETMAGRNLTDALQRMTLHIKSSDLERTIELLVHSLRSGGQLADLLDQTADDLRDQQIIQKEISASVLMYVLFIFIAIAIGAPLLFAMSSFLVELLTKNMAMIAKEMPKNFDMKGGITPVRMGGASVSGDFIRNYALISITLSSIFGSIIMGLILKGEEKEGLKYIVPMLIVALTLFYVASLVLKATIGGMMPAG